MTDSRIPPNSLDAERSLLGAALLSPVAVDTLMTVGVGHFYRPAHAHIAAAVHSLAGARVPIDAVTVADELRRAGLLRDVGGIEYLNELQLATPAVSAADHYARIIRDNGELRRLITVGSEIASLGYSNDSTHAAERVKELVAGLDRPDGTIDASWLAADLGPVLNGTRLQPMPTLLMRADMEALLYPASINGVHGASGAGKGWLNCFAIDQVMRSGRNVMLIDFEDTSESNVGRLTAIGCPPALILERLIYIRPQTAMGAREVDHVVRTCIDKHVALVVLDSLGEAFALEGIDENKDVEVGPWYRRVARKIAEAGPAVLIVDHCTKAADNPLYPSGSKRKRAAITGAMFLAEAVKPFVKGEGGRLRLTCAKDRHGNYRRGQVVANLVMARSLTNSVHLELYEPDTGEQSTELAAVLAARSAVAAAKDEGRPVNKTELRGLMKIKAGTDTKKAGIDLAIGRGALSEQVGDRNAKLVTYVCDLPEMVSK